MEHLAIGNNGSGNHAVVMHDSGKVELLCNRGFLAKNVELVQDEISCGKCQVAIHNISPGTFENVEVVVPEGFTPKVVEGKSPNGHRLSTTSGQIDKTWHELKAELGKLPTEEDVFKAMDGKVSMIRLRGHFKYWKGRSRYQA